MEAVSVPAAGQSVMYRCRGCRRRLFGSAETGALAAPLTCCRGARELRALPEERLPGWAQQQVEEAAWTRGRLLCPASGCGAKLGTFDFVSGATCDCRSSALPPVRLASSRLDEMTELPGAAAGGTDRPATAAATAS